MCDDGRLVGLVRGATLFREQAIEISARPGAMVGVEKEERLSTPWPVSLKFRHPWLQLNLLTAFLAAAVVGLFQKTIDEVSKFLQVKPSDMMNTRTAAAMMPARICGSSTRPRIRSGRAPSTRAARIWSGSTCRSDA